MVWGEEGKGKTALKGERRLAGFYREQEKGVGEGGKRVVKLGEDRWWSLAP